MRSQIATGRTLIIMKSGGEFDFIRETLRPLTNAHPGALDLSDDAAILESEPGQETVLSADMLVSGVHFLSTDTLEIAAHRALRSNLSDLAAMGAKPTGYLCSICWPKGTQKPAREQLVAGLDAVQSEYEIPLLGGDTTVADGPLTIAITVIGHVPAGQSLRRNGAKIGDDIWVSGTIGDAGLGLEIAKGCLDTQPFLLSRYQRPSPRLSLGRALLGVATACIDVSDGLVGDAMHVARQSAVGFEIEASMVPLSDPVLLWLEKEGEAGLKQVLTGGDDYELLFTAPHEEAGHILDLAREADVPISWIGRVGEGDDVHVHDENGQAITFDSPGFTHF
jgi:thiamine-monophosphate kinase